MKTPQNPILAAYRNATHADPDPWPALLAWEYAATDYMAAHGCPLPTARDAADAIAADIFNTVGTPERVAVARAVRWLPRPLARRVLSAAAELAAAELAAVELDLIAYSADR